MTKIIGWIVIIVLIIWGIIALEDNTSKETGPIKIGVSLPLTGEAASYGEGGMGGLQLALKEINETRGADARKIELIIEDDQCDSTGSTVFNKLVNVDKVVAIIGPLCSAAAGPAIPVAQNAGIPTIIWASAPNLTQTGDFIFRTYPSDSFQGIFSAEHIKNTLGKSKVAIVYVKNDWGQGLHDVFVKKFTELGGTIVFDEGVAQDTKDLKTIMSKVKAANPDLVYYPMYPAGAIAGLKQAKTIGLNVPFFSGDAFDTNEVLVPESEGVQYSIFKVNNPDEFTAKVKELTGGKTTNLMTPLTYDGLKILVSIIDKVGTDNKAIQAELAKLSYKGVSLPLIELGADRELKAADFVIKEIKGGKAVEVK